MGMGDNLNKGISPKMRLVMLGTVVVMVVFTVLGVKILSGSKPKGPDAAVKVEVAPDALKSGSAVGGDLVIPEDSPMGQELKKDRDSHLKDATDGKKSYFDKFEEGHEAAVKRKEAEAVLGGNDAGVPTGIDDVVAKKRRDEERDRRLADMRGNYDGNAAGGYDALLATEIKGFEDRDNEIKARISEYKTGRGALPVAIADFSSASKGNEGGASAPAAAQRGTSNVDRFEAAGDSSDLASSKADDSGLKPVIPGQRINTGDVLFSILVTPVNSDEVSPIWAIVAEEGKFKNARALGSFTRTGEKVVLQFNNLTVKGRDCQISAVAIDPNPDSYRTALADSVNNHTFTRYASLMAASFADGYADALSATTTQVNPTGGSTTQTNPLPDPGDRALVALGRVGKVLVPKFEKGFERPPTVTVNGRRQLGLLFMSPLDLSSCK